MIYRILVQGAHPFEPAIAGSPYGSTETERFRQRKAKIERLF